MTRDEHLAWAKQRAMEYYHRGDLSSAVASMLSDLGKHDELKGIGEKMILLGILYLTQQDGPGVERFIQGFR